MMNILYIVGIKIAKLNNSDNIEYENAKEIFSSFIESIAPECNINLIHFIGRSKPDNLDILRVVLTLDENNESEILKSLTTKAYDANRFLFIHKVNDYDISFFY